jgi:hypothetical protein
MERVLSVSVAGKHRLYPLTVLERHAVTNAELSGTPYVIFTKSGMASPLDSARVEEGRAIPAATAFQRRLDARVLEFASRDGRRIDVQTGSEWNLLGEAVAGPLKGKHLPSIESGVHFAFAWLAFNPDSEIVQTR